MKIKNYVTGSILFFAIMACAVPGLGQPAAPPTFDLSTIPTMVVLTANALEAQTAIAAPPTPLETSTSTLMPTESVTATPKISLSGTSLLLRDDQTTVFTDRQAGIELIIPAGWMPVRVNEQEYFDAFASNAAADLAIRDRLARIQTLDPAWFRLDAIDIQPGHVINEAPTFMSVIFQQNDSRSLEEVAKDEKVKSFANFEVISSDYQQAANGMKTLVVEQRWDVTTGVTYYKGVFFKIPAGLIVLDFYSPLDFKDTVLPDFEKVINSLTLLNP